MKKLLIIITSIFIFVGCDVNDSDDADPSTFTVTIENVSTAKLFLASGVFNTPKGDAGPGPVTPGKEYEFTVKAGKGSKISFVTMLAATNDLFYAPEGSGIPLYNDDGLPFSGEVTDQVYLWDAGTEVNEEPAVGPNTVTNQSGPDTGMEENGTVEMIGNISSDSFDYPDVSEVINVTVEHIDGAEFRISIENVSSDTALQTSEGDRAAPISPGWAVYAEGEMPIYIEGMPDFGEGLEAIAEDGNPTMLGESLMGKASVESSGVMNMTVGSTDPGPVLPGSMYEVSFDAVPGEHLSFATMLAATNDLFFGPSDEGIALFDANENPVSGDVSSQIYLWDAGTEVNEEPAIGPNTVTNQTGPDTGIEENGNVQRITNVNDGFTYPSTQSIIKVTITTN